MMTLLTTELRYSFPKLWPTAVIFTFPALMLLFKGFDGPTTLDALASDWGLILAFAAFSSIALHKNWHNLMSKEKRPLLLQPLSTKRSTRQQVIFWMAILFHLPVLVTVLILSLYVKKVGFELPRFFMLNSLLIVSAIIAIIQSASSLIAPIHQRARSATLLIGMLLLVFPLLLFADHLCSTEAPLVAHPAVSVATALIALIGTWIFAGEYRGLEYLSGRTS
ncbi:hypothetical protein KQI63_09465 [bacterium]|nr:hypothetical protein [bacterium]